MPGPSAACLCIKGLPIRIVRMHSPLAYRPRVGATYRSGLAMQGTPLSTELRRMYEWQGLLSERQLSEGKSNLGNTRRLERVVSKLLLGARLASRMSIWPACMQPQRGQVSRLVAAASAGQPITIAGVGGSVTTGIGAQMPNSGWLYRFSDWVQVRWLLLRCPRAGAAGPRSRESPHPHPRPPHQTLPGRHVRRRPSPQSGISWSTQPCRPPPRPTSRPASAAWCPPTQTWSSSSSASTTAR